MQDVFHAYEKNPELVTKLSFEISEIIAEKGKAYSDGKFIKNCLELFTRRVFPKTAVDQLSVSVYRGKANRRPFGKYRTFFKAENKRMFCF